MSKSKKKHLKLKGGNDCGGQCKERDNLVIFQRPPCQKKIDESSVAPPQPIAEDDDESKNKESTPTSVFSIVMLSLYIIIKYPTKYFVLFSILMVIIYLAQKAFEYLCLAIKKFINFFTIILNPGSLDLILFKVPNIFRIFMAFLELFIGILYLCVAIIFFIALGFLTLPFNLIVSI